MIAPGLDTYRRLSEAGYRYIPLYAEELNDTETPVTIFAKLTKGKGRFLLESVERGNQIGRYSFIGWQPFLTFTATGEELTLSRQEGSTILYGEPLATIKKELDSLRVAPLPELNPFPGGAAGYIGYDYVRQIEKLPIQTRPVTGLPDLSLVVPSYLVRLDHVTHKITTIVLSRADPEDIDGSYRRTVQELSALRDKFKRKQQLPPLPNTEKEDKAPAWSATLSKSQFMGLVQQIKEYIRAGEVRQVVLSHRIRQAYSEDPFFFYRVLRTVNPSPYLFYFDFGDHQLAGSSPEMMVRLTDGRVTLKPIAGTRRRGCSAEEDERLRQELLNDGKERAEHLMLVDSGREELDRVCRPGSVQVTNLMNVESYSHVIHLVSTLQGELLPVYSGFDLLRAVFPAGTLSGAPKRRALEIIEALEPTRREFYGGCVGYFGFNGNLDTCITIRTALFHANQVHLQVGAGIVADSDPEKEYAETMNKAAALLTALTQAGGEKR
ncbi:MAG: anthranilate synthase component I [Firmicutes bacterium]|nr:anthranilate synthase component I [Bacillota bacterium]